MASQFAEDKAREAKSAMADGDQARVGDTVNYLVQEGSVEDVVAMWQAFGGTREELLDEVAKIKGRGHD